MKPNFSSYLQSWSDEFSACANRVRQLIGDKHWLSDGHHKESIIREFLSKYLPSSLTISRGFVRPPNDSLSCSPEVDILIAAPSLHPPLFYERDLQIVPPTSVVAHLEVKTTLEGKSIQQAMSGIMRIQDAVSTYAEPNKIWRGIIFADTSNTQDSESMFKLVLKSISAILEDPTHQIKNKIEIWNLPNCIATFSRFVVFFVPTEQPRVIKVKIFNAGGLSLACAFADLFSMSQLRLGGKGAFEFDELIESLVLDKPFTAEINLDEVE